MNLQIYAIVSTLLHILGFFLRSCPGILSYLVVKLCCLSCNPKVERTSNIFKYAPPLLFGLQTVILVSYLLLCYSGIMAFNIIITIYLSLYILCALFTWKWYKKIPVFCFGRRRCFAYTRSEESLKEILLRVDLFVPIRQEVASLQNICMRKGGEVVRYSLERKFNEIHPVNVLFTGSAFENFGLPTSSDWINDFDTIPHDYPLLTDFDLMMCIDNVIASEGNDPSTHFHMQKSTEQGFVMLSVTEYGLVENLLLKFLIIC